MLSYLNDVKLKKEIVEEMKKHRKNDQIVKGTYGKENGMFKGCAVGCAIHSLNIRKGKDLPYDGHRYFESELGIPEWLARLNDKIFEGLPGGDNTEFAVDFLQAIPVGVDLESIKWKFCSYLLKENIERVLSLKIKDELKEQVVNAIRQVLVVHETAIKTNEWNESAAARSAESAAAKKKLIASLDAWFVKRIKTLEPYE